MSEHSVETERPAVPRVLVVCTGNLCRSPLAEALLRRELAIDGIGAEVSSAGLIAPPALQPDRRLRRVANELGVAVDSHLSTPLSRDGVRHADLILTMTGEQSDEVRALDLSAVSRTLTLRAAGWRARVVAGQPASFADWVSRLVSNETHSDGVRPDPAHDIPDPTGGPLRDYRAMGDEVRALVRAIVDHWSGR